MGWVIKIVPSKLVQFWPPFAIISTILCTNKRMEAKEGRTRMEGWLLLLRPEWNKQGSQFSATTAAAKLSSSISHEQPDDHLFVSRLRSSNRYGVNGLFAFAQCTHWLHGWRGVSRTRLGEGSVYLFRMRLILVIIQCSFRLSPAIDRAQFFHWCLLNTTAKL